MRVESVLCALFLGACVPAGSFSGTLVDGMNGEPHDGVRILAKSNDTTDLTCQVREATTDATGSFTIADTCGKATYVLSLTDKTLFVPSFPKIVGSETSAEPTEIKAWRAPAGAGVSILREDTLKAVRTFSDVAAETALRSGEPIRYPDSKPTTNQALVGAGSHLIIAGKSNVERLELVPLVQDEGRRRFEDGVTITDHVYLGIKFNTHTNYEQVEAKIDSAKVEDVSGEGRVVRYMAHDSVPAGRYGLLGPKDKRLFVIDFGAAPADAE